MSQHGAGDLFHVVGQHVVAPPQGGHGLRRAKQGDRGPRARPEANVVVPARFVHDLHQVAPDFVIDVDFADRALTGDQFLAGDDRLQAVDRMRPLQELEQLEFLL